MGVTSINRGKTIWHHIIYILTWVFLWGYYIFIAPTTFKLLSDIGQEPWFLSMVPKYTLFFGLIVSIVSLYISYSNVKKLGSGTGGSSLKSIVAISIAYFIPLITFAGEVSLIVQTAIAIPIRIVM